MISISYCISVCNEHEELNRLLEQLISHITSEDEIIVLVDKGKVTNEVNQVLKKHRNILPSIKVIRASLHGDFAAFKNNFLKYAAKKFISRLMPMNFYPGIY